MTKPPPTTFGFSEAGGGPLPQDIPEPRSDRPVVPASMGEITQLRMGLDEFRRACAERPEKVVDAFVAMCDDYEDLLPRLLQIPLGTPAADAVASQLQGRGLALQAVLNELYDQVTTPDLDDGDHQ